MKKLLVLAALPALLLTGCVLDRQQLQVDDAKYAIECVESGGTFYARIHTMTGKPECVFVFPELPKGN